MEVLLEIPPRPAMLGEPLTLKCEVQGGAEIKTAVFYKDGAQIQTTSDGSYKISAVTDKDQGSYRCKATYRYTYTNPHGAFKEKVDSEPQTLNIRGTLSICMNLSVSQYILQYAVVLLSS